MKQMLRDDVEIAAVAQLRQRHLEGVEAIEQVGTEAALGNGLVQGRVGRGHEEDIDLGPDATDRTHGPIVEQAQQHRLKRNGHVADLVEKQRAAVGFLHQPDRAAASCSGECAVGVAEQLGFDQIFRQGGAIDSDECTGPPAGEMGVAGELLLAGAGFAADQDWHCARRSGLDPTDNGPHRRIPGDEAGGRGFASGWRRGRAQGLGRGFCFPQVAIGEGRASARVQHEDRPNIVALAVHRIEARVRQQLFQFDRPLIERQRLQKADWRVMVEAAAAVAQGAQGVFGGMKDRAATVEHDAFFAGPERSPGEEVAEQSVVILPDGLRQHAFHVMPDGHRQSQALRVEGACRAGDIDHAEQFAVTGIVNRNGGAGPALHLRAEMFGAVNLHRLGFRHGGADGVGADVGFAPASAVFQVNGAAGVDDPGVSLGIDDQPGGVGEDHHGIGVAQERLRTLERAPCGMTECRVLGAVTKQFTLRNQRRHRAIDRDVVTAGSLP